MRMVYMKNELEQKHLFKERVIGYVVSILGKENEKGTVYLNPIIGDWEASGNWYDLDEDEKFITSISAQPNTFKQGVFCPDCGEVVELGYEHEGAYHPDWLETAKKELESHSPTCPKNSK